MVGKRILNDPVEASSEISFRVAELGLKKLVRDITDVL